MKYNYTYTAHYLDTQEIEVTCQRQLTEDEVVELTCEIGKGTLDDNKKYEVTDNGSVGFNYFDYNIEGDELLNEEEE